MFEQKKKFDVASSEVIDFVRLLGRFGMKFQISEEYMYVDDKDPNRKHYFRRFYVFGTRREFNDFFEARDILLNYHLH